MKPQKPFEAPENHFCLNAPEHDWNEVILLRIKVANLIQQWGGAPITTMLGYTNNSDITSEHIETLQRIAGPHGFAIYKALEARNK